MLNFQRLKISTIAVAAFIAATPTHASTLTDFGITYSLFGTAVNATTDQFTLNISGINGALDTEGGRSGVNAIAFGKPAHFSSAIMITPASGFTYALGGLNSSGCNGSGNFFCFAANVTPPKTPALAAGSTLSFVFDVTISSGSFASYDPDFKIDWIGSKNNYDLVSLALAPTFCGPTTGIGCPSTTLESTPLPAALPLFATGLGGLGLLGWRRKRKAAALAA